MTGRFVVATVIKDVRRQLAFIALTGRELRE